ncbi:MAG: NADH:ubiquinone oxidoreductase subunit NDUFA12 [Sphingorhabdus sp.]|nr:NADH:ubiquinone oxidoreductase subunit NDUFA12 [Sphingorhabdus sp.]
MGILAKIFTWWDGATIGTALFSARNGIMVGEDAEGNRYYRNRNDSRRWVIYQGPNDASRVAPDWHGWLHHTFEGEPDSYLPPKRNFELPASVNATGSQAAYRPGGAIEQGGKRQAATGDYTAWSPDAA